MRSVEKADQAQPARTNRLKDESRQSIAAAYISAGTRIFWYNFTQMDQLRTIGWSTSQHLRYLIVGARDFVFGYAVFAGYRAHKYYSIKETPSK